MAFQTDAFQADAFQVGEGAVPEAPPVAAAISRPVRARPAVWVYIEDYPVQVSNWSMTSRANLGFDQFRSVMGQASLAKLPWTSGQGSPLTAYTADGEVAWQGHLAGDPRVGPDDVIRIAAQGNGYDATKRAMRLPIRVKAIEGWVVANTLPLDFPQTATAQPTIAYTKQGVLVNNAVQLSVSSGTQASIAFWAPGASLRRLTYSSVTESNGGSRIWAATGPGISDSRVLIRTYDAGAGFQWGSGDDVEIPDQGLDCIIFEWDWSAPATTTVNLVSPEISAGTKAYNLFSHTIARAIGDSLDWDTSYIADEGTVLFPTFDWAAEVSGALGEAAAPDDFRWRVVEDRGAGPVLEFGDWARTWEVSSRDSRWALDPLEAYNRVTVSYLDALGKAKQISVDADPDPFNGRLINELRAVVGGLQSVDEVSLIPDVMAANLLAWAISPRHRGTVEIGRAYTDGREARYQVRGGDLLRITDFSPTDGAVTLRIAEVTQTEGGVTVGIEAPTFTTGEVTGPTATGPGLLLAPTENAYAPPGSPGSTTPTTWRPGLGFLPSPLPPTAPRGSRT